MALGAAVLWGTTGTARALGPANAAPLAVGAARIALPDAAASIDPLGLLLTLAAGAGYAVYATATKRLLASADNVAVAALAFGGGAVILIPVLVLVDMHWLSEPRGYAVVLWLG